MCNVRNEKNRILGEVAALKVLVQDRKSQSESIWSSINNARNNPIDFLLDLIKELVGYEELRDGLAEFLANNLIDVEDAVKTSLKLNLKEFMGCGINPSIPNEFLFNNQGYSFSVEKLDYTNIFNTEPDSRYGKVKYFDNQAGVNSRDCNTFLYNVIQQPGVSHSWGSQVNVNDILTFRYEDTIGNEVEQLVINASAHYSNPNNNLKWFDLCNDYIDSQNIYPNALFFSGLIDNAFNGLSGIITRTEEECEVEVMLEVFIDNLLETEPDEYIDDSFFTFSNQELGEIKRLSKNRSLGIATLESCEKIGLNLTDTDLDNIVNILGRLETSSTYEERISGVRDGMDILLEQGDGDFKFNRPVLLRLIKALVKAIILMLFTPKIFILFVISLKNLGEEINSVEDIFILLKPIIKNIVDEVKGLVVSYLLNIVMRELRRLSSQVSSNIAREYVVNRSKTILSLANIPQEVIRQITKF